jgi:hypothetical protein
MIDSAGTLAFLTQSIPVAALDLVAPLLGNPPGGEAWNLLYLRAKIPAGGTLIITDGGRTLTIFASADRDAIIATPFGLAGGYVFGSGNPLTYQFVTGAGVQDTLAAIYIEYVSEVL